jgi:hypothetical protein
MRFAPSPSNDTMLPAKKQFAISHAACYNVAAQGGWLSWLERAVHIREVIGSTPIPPTLLLNYGPRHVSTRAAVLAECVRTRRIARGRTHSHG